MEWSGAMPRKRIAGFGRSTTLLIRSLKRQAASLNFSDCMGLPYWVSIPSLPAIERR